MECLFNFLNYYSPAITALSTFVLCAITWRYACIANKQLKFIKDQEDKRAQRILRCLNQEVGDNIQESIELEKILRNEPGGSKLILLNYETNVWNNFKVELTIIDEDLRTTLTNVYMHIKVINRILQPPIITSDLMQLTNTIRSYLHYQKIEELRTQLEKVKNQLGKYIN